MDAAGRYGPQVALGPSFGAAPNGGGRCTLSFGCKPSGGLSGGEGAVAAAGAAGSGRQAGAVAAAREAAARAAALRATGGGGAHGEAKGAPPLLRAGSGVLDAVSARYADRAPVGIRGSPRYQQFVDELDSESRQLRQTRVLDVRVTALVTGLQSLAFALLMADMVLTYYAASCVHSGILCARDGASSSR